MAIIKGVLFAIWFFVTCLMIVTVIPMLMFIIPSVRRVWFNVFPNTVNRL